MIFKFKFGMLLLILLITSCTPQEIPPRNQEPLKINISLNITTNTTNITIMEIKPIKVFIPRDNNLTVYYLDIDGDAILIHHKDKAVLINSGYETDSERILKIIRDLGIERLDYVLATNTQPKNIGGMPYILLRTNPEFIIENGIPSTFESYKLYKELYSNTTIIKQDTVFTIGEFFIKTIVAYDDGEGFSTDLNQNSIVTKIHYGNSKFLSMSDCSLGCEERLKDTDLTADVLQISSSCYATSLAFLKRVNPKIAVLSIQEEFCPDIIDRFKFLNIPLYITSEKGDIFVTTDGLNYHVDWKRGRNSSNFNHT